MTAKYKTQRTRRSARPQTHVVVKLSRDTTVFGADVRLGEEGRHLWVKMVRRRGLWVIAVGVM